MIIDNVMFNNFDASIKTPQGLRLCRYPLEVMEKMNPNARHMARYACNSEIRFVTEAPTCFVNLLSEAGSGEVVIYYGDYVVGKRMLETGKITRIDLNIPQIIKGLKDEFYKNNKYKFGVWRLHFHNTVLTFCDIDTMGYSIRPPKPEEMPERTMLSYGSSISHGAGSCYNPTTYVNTLADCLGVDCIAKGIGGSCFAEPEIADNFAERDDWYFALLEIGVNMIRQSGIDAEEFKKRFSYFADKMYSTNKKLIFLTIFPYSAMYAEYGDERNVAINFNETIRNKCAEFDKNRVLLVEGKDVLTSTEMLSADGIHPSTEGHIKMGYNLYNIVKEFLK